MLRLHDAPTILADATQAQGPKYLQPEMERPIAREATEALEDERKTWLIGDT